MAPRVRNKFLIGCALAVLMLAMGPAADALASAQVRLVNARGGSDQPFSTTELTDKIDALTRAAFPAMPAVLRGLIADPQAAGATHWSDLVAQMTR